MTGKGGRLRGLLVFCFTALLVAQAQPNPEGQVAEYAAAGQRAMAQGDYAAAQDNFAKLAKLEPGIAEVHATLAAISFKLHDYDRAISEVHTAQRLKPGLPRLDSLLGLSLAEKGSYSRAVPYLEKGFKQTGDAEVRRMCGLELLRTYTQLGRDADAVETALAMNRLYPNDPEVLYHTGRIYGNFAWVTMEKLHDTAPGSVWMLQAQGEANESQKAWEPAIIAFNHVLAIDPKRPGIHYQLGRIYLARFREAGRQEDREAAMREFTAELSVAPQNGNAAYELANMQAEAGNLDEAHRAFEALLQQYPDFEEALVGLAGIDLTRQKPDEAAPLLQRAIRLRPDDEVAWWRLAQADRAMGNAQGQKEALAEFQKIHQTIPVTLRRPDAVDEVTPQQLGPGEHP
jgi:tetratricopeptide (TPR) repeat protein